MSAATMPPAELSHDVAGRSQLPPAPPERAFWTALAIAVALHAALFVGIGRQIPRQIGDPGGAADGISVDLIDAATLFGNSAAQPPGAGPAPEPAPEAAAQPPSPETAAPPPEPPAEAAARAEPPPPATPPPTPAEAPPAAPVAPAAPSAVPDEPAVETAVEPARPPPREATARPSPPPPEPPPAPTADALERQRPDLLTLKVPPAAETGTAAAPRRTAPQQPQAKLDLTPPAPDLRRSYGGGGAAVGRPPGITKSGENDDFARRVVAALRQTMPRMSARGRVTVRLIISEIGNLAEVRLLGNTGDPVLPPSIVFSTRQASFPIPPARSKEVDRIFLVTYIYD